MQEMILILDFGSQYTQLIARRVRELNVYCEIHPFNKIPATENKIKGVILSGSPFSVHDEGHPIPELSAIRGKYPLLAVCYGAQFLAQNAGGKVERSKIREYGRANLSFIDDKSPLIAGMNNGSQVWMSHGDTITILPESCKIIASTHDVEVAGYQFGSEPTFAIQFHPEVYHTSEGMQLLTNFVVDICGCSQNWTPDCKNKLAMKK
jgi:GMP synthase (glutamine-hydrolysing)